MTSPPHNYPWVEHETVLPVSTTQAFPAVAVGVGVHRTLFKSCSLAFVCPSQPAILPIASALLAAAVLMVVRSSNLLAAGVRLPSARLGVHVGGGMDPCLVEFNKALLTVDGVRSPPVPKSSALARKVFEALADSFCEMRSRADGGRI